MNDVLAVIFLVLALTVGIPLVIFSLVLTREIKRGRNIFYVLISLGIILIIGSTVLSIIGGTNSKLIVDNYYYSYFYRHPCVWVGMGLSIGSMAVNLITTIVLIIISIYNEHNLTHKEAKEKVQSNEQPRRYSTNRKYKSYDYIDEIRELKKLLECGAITQQEYDMKKKQILDNVLN